QFLGEVHENTLEKIKTLLSSIVFSPFNVKFIGVGTFPRPSKPRIIWIGTDGEGGNNLVHLAKQIEDVLEPIGFKPDKPFKPHITVFRVKKNPTNIIKQLEKF
ncbi:MAG: RNA 2',3'-cyclic phosphodiesterase, partial [Nitrosopumilaceae archaeon]|nr:RNA 2',3'-cyclic phosphodiesterase [Nitrosopumilaceae archaeon]NIU88072.1 RNA 2',3'-cyclic phosphodiesterase [Nitrosopumilaceae archaeon]NIV67235.1 RNA 2',3'-cyclic phosphodiesterase [Nitrosopumilaceae archaeon]NIX63292.1 RNA 2',3'-cyclic phosphodiesterase [Nitrosopumilaceae archaeon]